jgi:2-polyprenyl-3-methyl-5-hydroxy-6-metoxy-1,4-benzoquinol methylase
MSHPLVQKARSALTVENAQRVGVFLWRHAVGIAQDFWKDGGVNAPVKARVTPTVSTVSPGKIILNDEGLWHAAPGEVSEKMWGKSIILPCDEALTELMIAPMGLKKDMSVLDLSAGLGERMREITQKFRTSVTGREADAEIAARGKGDGISAYEPANLTEMKLYDGVIAREILYRVADKEKFVTSIVSCCKPRAHISFTDYIVNPETAAKPSIVAWRAFEVGTDPIGLVKMAEIWAKAGISLSAHDDQTELYRREVKHGLVRLAEFMATGIRPDAETKKTIQKSIVIWAHRIAAMDAGMKIYRFYGSRR